jgi:type I restriction enzyme S subunit
MSKKLKKNVPVLRFSEFEGDWEISNVGSACEVKNNLRKPISLPERDLMQGSYPYYGPTGIIDYLNEYGIDGKFAMIGEDGDHFLKYKSWSQTQLVEGRFNANNHVHIISGTNKCLVEWFFVYFRHRNIIDFLTRQGAARYKLNKASLVTLPITLPKIAEQEKIASFLGAIDRRLTQLHRKRELLQTYKRGVMQKIFSQKIRFKDAIGSPFPDWKKKKLGELTFKVGKKNKENVPYPIYSINNQKGFVPQSEQFEGVDSNERGYDISLYKIIQKNTFAYNPARINVGSIGYSGELENIIISSLYVCFKTKQELCDFYLLQYLETFEFNKSVLRNVEGGVREYLFYENFSNIKISLPSPKEQEKIAKFLTAIDHKIEALSRQIDQTEKFKKGLLQKMFV